MAITAVPTGASSASSPTRALCVDVALVFMVHALACAFARVAGFDHVSDDDFARVTIAQAFAHAPKLDPSGTSWLPFPFWITGSAMAAIGRSLDAARIVSVLVASAAASTPYLALRYAGAPRGRAILATAFAFATPWAIWLGAATVPESMTASLTAAGTVGLAAARARDASSPREATHARRGAPAKVAILFALAVAAASLSRYESWPIAAVLALALTFAAGAPNGFFSAEGLDPQTVRRTRRERRVLFASALLCAIGPLLWMAWNAHAHDGPLHFFRRVSSFKRAIEGGATDAVDALSLYPRLLFTTRPELAIPAVFLLASLRVPAIRRRWALPLVCVVAQIAFLAYGNARDGAPTHHPERALFGATVVLALFVTDAGMSTLRELVTSGRALTAKAGAACVAVAWVISSVRGADPPGQSPSEDRREQIARGEALRQTGARGIVVTPCAYEHFALLAAYGAPERAEIVPTATPRIADGCPAVELR